MMQKVKEAPVVSVICLTFNQKNFVRQCIDSILMQKTNFRFEILIHDDASSDGTKEIIKEYEVRYNHLIKPILEENNIYSIGGFWAIFDCVIPNISGKYVALCEGDDYWIDPQKLQRQFDFMEAHEDYMLCFHGVQENYEGRPELNKIRAVIENRDYSGLEWYKKRPSQTASFFFKRSIFNTSLFYKIKNLEKLMAADVPLLLTCSKYGKIRGIKEVMSVYRHNESGWTSRIRDKNETLKIINSQLEYKIFGKEIEKASIYFYQRDCVSAFLTSIKHHSFDLSFLNMSIKASFSGTIKALYKIIQHKYD